MKKIDPTTRRTWMKMLFGAGGIGLTAAATGLPLSFLRQRAMADAGNARFLVLMANAAGDGLNCNAPGSYDADFVDHPSGADFAPVDLRLGAQTARGARVWEGLGEDLLARSAFIHHATRTVVHPDQPKVLTLQGDTQGGLSIPEIVAQHNAGPLDTLQRNPVSLGARSRDSFIVDGAPLPRLTPIALKSLLAGGGDPVLPELAAIRDRDLNRIYDVLQENGNPEQRAFLDNMAQTRAEAEVLAERAGDLLAGVEDNGPLSQVKAALALIELRVAPVIGVNFPFGGDNHTDLELAEETARHPEGIAAIRALFEEAGPLADRVTFATFNVFGRSLRMVGNGRSHNPAHSVSLIIGPETVGGVYGGLEERGSDGGAATFDSATGRVSEDGDVSFEAGLPSVGKTIACAAGLPTAAVDGAILAGHPVSAIFPAS